MVKKIKKYLKFVVCCTLIMSLVAPSYAALSASDGSAFVTKAEFDSALADFNARLTTFEAGINSKIDSQVTSYLDRNGIWNGQKQEFWKWWEDSHYIAIKNANSTNPKYALSCKQFNDDFAPFAGVGTNYAVPLVENITKSGLLQYYIPCLWWEGNSYEMHLRNRMWTFLQTSVANTSWCSPTAGGTNAPLSLQPTINYNNGTFIFNSINSTQTGAALVFAEFCAPYVMMVNDVSVNKVRYNSFTFNMSADVNRLPNTLFDAFSRTNPEVVPAADPEWKKIASDVRLYDSTPAPQDLYALKADYDRQLMYTKNVLTRQLWGWDDTTESVEWLSTITTRQLIDQMTLVSGFVFVEKGKPLFIAPGAGIISYYVNQDAPVTDNWVRTSGTSAVLKVY